MGNMRLKEGVDSNILLEKYDFTKAIVEKYDTTYEEKEGKLVIYDDSVLYGYEDNYFYLLGFGRRGQVYYLMLNPNDRCFSLISTEPDGSGSATSIDDIFSKLFNNGIVE